MDLNEFKEHVGKPLSEVTISDLREMMKDNEMMMALNDLEIGNMVSDEIMKTNKDPEVISEFAPLAYHHQFYGAQRKLGQMFAQYNLDSNEKELTKSLDEFLAGATPLGKLNGYMIALTTLDGYEINLDDLQKAVKDSEEILFKMEIEKGFPIICDIIDMLYTLQEEYYKKYNYDLIADDAEKLNKFIEKLDEFVTPVYEKMQEDISRKLPDDITPEDIGMLDMTKFKENANEKEE